MPVEGPCMLTLVGCSWEVDCRHSEPATLNRCPREEDRRNLLCNVTQWNPTEYCQQLGNKVQSWQAKSQRALVLGLNGIAIFSEWCLEAKISHCTTGKQIPVPWALFLPSILKARGLKIIEMCFLILNGILKMDCELCCSCDLLVFRRGKAWGGGCNTARGCQHCTACQDLNSLILGGHVAHLVQMHWKGLCWHCLRLRRTAAQQQEHKIMMWHCSA